WVRARQVFDRREPQIPLFVQRGILSAAPHFVDRCRDENLDVDAVVAAHGGDGRCVKRSMSTHAIIAGMRSISRLCAPIALILIAATTTPMHTQTRDDALLEPARPLH